MAVRNGADLAQDQRLRLAMISGHGQRLALGTLEHLPSPDAIAQLHAITRDPVVYGVALGAALANVELDGWAHAAALVDLYRAAGADEEVAASCLDWHRDRPAYRNRPSPRLSSASINPPSCPDD